jgi:hypothetical protein
MVNYLTSDMSIFTIHKYSEIYNYWDFNPALHYIAKMKKSVLYNNYSETRNLTDQ